MGVADTVIRGVAKIGERMGGLAEGAAAREELCTLGAKLFNTAYDNVAVLAKPVAKSDWREEMQLYEAAKKTGFAETRQKLGLSTDIGRNSDQVVQPLGSNLVRPFDSAALAQKTGADVPGGLLDRPSRSRELNSLIAELEARVAHKVSGISQRLSGGEIDAIGKGTYRSYNLSEPARLEIAVLREKPHSFPDAATGDRVFPA